MREVFASGPLGAYSYDHFHGYSPPVVVRATGLAQPNEEPLMLVLEITNNERNLQLPIDDLASGMDVHVAWAAVDAPAGAARAPALGAAPTTGQLWAKPLGGGAGAALLINHSPHTVKYTLQPKLLNLTAAAFAVRDVWAHADLPAITTGLDLAVPAWDSALVKLTPA